MNREVAHGSVWEVELERLPRIAVVERNVHGSFRAGVEQALAPGIFANDIGRRVVGDTAGDLDPSRAEIARAVEVRVEIVEAKTIDRRIGGAGSEVRGFNDGDFAPGLKLGRRDILPVFPAIACELYLAVVGTGPDGVHFLEGGSDGVDRAAMLAFFRISGFEWAEVGREFVGSAGKVRADHGPIAALVGGFEKDVGGEIESFGIEMREDNWKCAVVAIFAAADGFGGDIGNFTDVLASTREFSTVHEIGVVGIDGDVAIFEDTREAPLAESDLSVVGAAHGGRAAAFLLRAVDPVGETSVSGYVIELAGWLVVPT